MRRGYLRGNVSYKKVEEGPLSSLQTPSVHSALPCPQSILLSLSRPVHNAGTLDSARVKNAAIHYNRHEFFPTNSQVRKILLYFYTATVEITGPQLSVTSGGKYSISAILRVAILLSRIEHEFRELSVAPSKRQESPVPMLSDEQLII